MENKSKCLVSIVGGWKLSVRKEIDCMWGKDYDDEVLNFMSRLLH